MTAVLLVVAVVAGYLAGRARPARRISDWAAWQQRPRGLRFAAVWTIRSVENIGWLIGHPAKGLHAWRTRNDPPPRGEMPVRVDLVPPEHGDPR